MHALLLALRDQRPEVEVAARRPGAQCGEALRELRDHAVPRRAFDQDAAARGTGLPAVLDDRVDQHRQRRLEVGVGEHDLRRLAAEFQRDRAVVRGGGLRHAPSGVRRTGERDVVDARVLRQRLPGLCPQAGDDVQGAGGQAGLRAEFGRAKQRQAGILGRLHHAGVARRERRAHRSPEDLHRVVPRNDVAGHAVRLADRHHRVAVLVGNGLAVQLVGRSRVVLEVARERGRVGASLADRLAGVARFELREFLRGAGHQVGPAAQHAAALGRGGRAPGHRRSTGGPRSRRGLCRRRFLARSARRPCRRTDRRPRSTRRRRRARLCCR